MAKTGRKQNLVTLFVVIVLFAGIGNGIYFSIKNDRIPSNPPGTVGNTAGNLNNGGLYCESEGVVYFSNAFDGGALYSMNSNETNLKRLNASTTQNILAGGNYLYYFQTGSSNRGSFGYLRSPATFNRCRKDGKKVESLVRSIIVNGQLTGDYLILLDNNESSPCIKKLKIDKSDESILFDYQINPSCAVGNTIYYNETTSDHYLYSVNTVSGAKTEIWEHNLWYPIVDGDYVYFLDIENGYKLCRHQMSADITETLTTDRVECYNLGNGYIYYQTGGKDPKLMWMYLDGSGKTVVAQGVYTKINMTSMYVYVQPYNDKNTVYHSALGGYSLETFTNAYASSLDD